MSDNDKCILEYSEEQDAWHFNIGDNKLNTNGYKPVAQGNYLGIENLMKIVYQRAGNKKLTMKEAQDLVFKCIYDYTDLLPKVRYIIS